MHSPVHHSRVHPPNPDISCSFCLFFLPLDAWHSAGFILQVAQKNKPARIVKFAAQRFAPAWKKNPKDNQKNRGRKLSRGFYKSKMGRVHTYSCRTHKKRLQKSLTDNMRKGLCVLFVWSSLSCENPWLVQAYISDSLKWFMASASKTAVVQLQSIKIIACYWTYQSCE